MLSNGKTRGFTPEKLAKARDSRVGCDRRGYFINTVSENVKVYFDDFYRFLEKTELKTRAALTEITSKIESTPPEMEETLAYLRAKKIVIEQLLRAIEFHYTDSASLASIMSDWCFGTVVLEKIEIYRDKIARGLVYDPNIPDYPYFVLRYIDEIYKVVLLELFEFPSKAFSMRWQYTELLKRYSKTLSNVTNSI